MSEEWSAVLDYWFGGGDRSKRPSWFFGGEKGAQEIRDKFGPLGTPKAFDRDPYCNMLAKKFLERKTHDHLKMSPSGRVFIYLPIEHSENLDDQKLSVELFKKLRDESVGTPEENDTQGFFDYAERHLVVVEQFGRFPRRNAAIGRESTPEEVAWLENTPAGYGF